MILLPNLEESTVAWGCVTDPEGNEAGVLLDVSEAEMATCPHMHGHVVVSFYAQHADDRVTI
jgi:hypothetical protein